METLEPSTRARERMVGATNLLVNLPTQLSEENNDEKE